MIEMAVNFPYIREFLAKRGIGDLHSLFPPFVMKKSSSFSSADMMGYMTGYYFHDVSPSTLLIMTPLDF